MVKGKRRRQIKKENGKFVKQKEKQKHEKGGHKYVY